MNDIIEKVLAEFKETPYGVRHRLSFFASYLHSYAQELGHLPSILEVGCGTGELVSIPLGKMGFPVIGIDIHEPSIQKGREKIIENEIPNVTLKALSLDDLLPSAPQFDVVICSEVLEHLVDPTSMLKLFALVTKSSGRCLITVPNGYGPFETDVWVFNIYVRYVRPFVKIIKSRFLGMKKTHKTHNDQECATKSSGGTLNRESPHIHFFSWRSVNLLFKSTGWHVQRYSGRSVLCGPLLDKVVHTILGNHWNVVFTKFLPPFMVSGFMFQLDKSITD